MARGAAGPVEQHVAVPIDDALGVFAGTDEAEQAKRRRAATELYQRRDYSPQRAAEEILRATRRAPAIAPVTPEARAGLVLSRLTPRLLRAAARADLMPK